MGILTKAMSTDEVGFFPHLNTGTLLDLANGQFTRGIKGELILNGGLSFTNGVSGKPQRFKTGIILSWLAGVMCRYLDIEAFVYDSESSISMKDRILDMINEPEYFHLADKIRSNLVLMDHLDYDLEGLWQHINDLYAKKLKMKKELTIEIPMIDPETGKAYRMLKPTVYIIDSLTKARLEEEFNKLSEKGVSSSDNNMINMDDGRYKTNFVNHLANIAKKAGIYFIVTTHLKDVKEMNRFAVKSKDLTFTKQSEDITGTGSSYRYSIHSTIELRKATPLQDKNKQHPLYPMPWSNATELMYSEGITTRGKNNQSGLLLNQVLSQNIGILRGITNHHLLRTNKVGYTVSGQHRNMFSIKWLEDVKPFHDNKARLVIDENARLRRALDIIGQLTYIKKYWSLFKIDPFVLENSVDDFVDLVHKRGNNFIDDILNSRGYWTYDKKDPKPFLSLMDIVSLLTTGNVTKSK